jgi:uncharacterized membrane protein
MNIAPFFEINTALAIHLVTVVIAFSASVYIFIAAKGTRAHKFAGRIAASALVVTALATFGINSFNSPFFGLSPIHIFSAVVLFFVPYALWQIRRGNVEAHRQAMTGVSIGGFGVAGALTFLPGRMMAEVFFG